MRAIREQRVARWHLGVEASVEARASARAGGGATAPRGDLSGPGSAPERVQRPSTRRVRPRRPGCRAAAPLLSPLPTSGGTSASYAAWASAVLVPGRKTVGPMLADMSWSATKHVRSGARSWCGLSGWMGCRGAPGSERSAESS
eukprot:scaffold18308_cov63-Phaeocystis_antarctica.AAC.3